MRSKVVFLIILLGVPARGFAVCLLESKAAATIESTNAVRNEILGIIQSSPDSELEIFGIQSRAEANKASLDDPLVIVDLPLEEFSSKDSSDSYMRTEPEFVLYFLKSEGKTLSSILLQRTSKGWRYVRIQKGRCSAYIEDKRNQMSDEVLVRLQELHFESLGNCRSGKGLKPSSDDRQLYLTPLFKYAFLSQKDFPAGEARPFSAFRESLIDAVRSYQGQFVTPP